MSWRVGQVSQVLVFLGVFPARSEGSCRVPSCRGDGDRLAAAMRNGQLAVLRLCLGCSRKAQQFLELPAKQRFAPLAARVDDRSCSSQLQEIIEVEDPLQCRPEA